MGVFRALMATSLVYIYLLVGIATLHPVNRMVVDACQKPAGVTAHILLWPISILGTWGMKSRC